MLRKLKKYIQPLSLNDQLYDVNEMIEYVNCSDIDDPKKIKAIIGLKQIRYTVLLSMKKVLAHKFNAIKSLITEHSATNIMRKINPRCCNEGSFIYSILILLHYYDIS